MGRVRNSLVVRIPGFHPGDPGSSPGYGSFAGIAQLGERQTEDLKVACSIHAHRKRFRFAIQDLSADFVVGVPCEVLVQGSVKMNDMEGFSEIVSRLAGSKRKGDLGEVLDSMRGKKLLVLDVQLSGPLAFITQTSCLKVENVVTKQTVEATRPRQFDTSEVSKQVFDNSAIRDGTPSVKV